MFLHHYLSPYLFLAVLGLRGCMSFSLVGLCGLLGVVISLVAGHTLQGVWACRGCGSPALERRPSSCGAQAQLFCSMWDLSRSGFQLRSPALAGGLFTTEPQGSPPVSLF